jgi:hypothetical protein
LPPPETWPVALEALAATHKASWVVAARFGALDEVMERFGARARRHDDATTQFLSLVGILREMTVEGSIERWPRRLSGVPVPTAAMVHVALDSVCANGHAIALGMFKDGELWTSFVARRQGGLFDVIAGPDEIRGAMGVLSGDFRRDYPHLVEAVERVYAPLSLGCFGEVGTFRDLLLDGRPGAWARAVALRDIVLAPAPLAVGLAVGFDGARFAYQSVRDLASRLDPFGFALPVLDAARRRAAGATDSVTRKKQIEDILGFDPMAALRALLRR